MRFTYGFQWTHAEPFVSAGAGDLECATLERWLALPSVGTDHSEADRT